MIKILKSDKIIDSIKIGDTVVIECVDSKRLSVMKVKKCSCGCSLVEVVSIQNMYICLVKGYRTLFSLVAIKKILKEKKYVIE